MFFEEERRSRECEGFVGVEGDLVVGMMKNVIVYPDSREGS